MIASEVSLAAEEQQMATAPAEVSLTAEKQQMVTTGHRSGDNL